jgi:serine/threonine-protein kinase
MKHVSEIPIPIGKHRGDAPPDLTAAIERALAKRPEERWQSAAELRDILSGRHVPAFAGRNSSRERAAQGRAPLAPPVLASERAPAGSARSRERDRPAHEPRRDREPTVAERIRKVRHLLVSYTGISGMLFVINASVQGDPWFIIPSAVLAADLLRRFGGLWADGIPMSWVFRRPERDDIDVLNAELHGRFTSDPGQRAALVAPGALGAGRSADALGRARSEASRADPAAFVPPSSLAGDPRSTGQGATAREVREQLRAAAQMRADVEDDRRIWGRATSLERRFKMFRRQTLFAAAAAGLSSGLFVLTIASGGDAAPAFVISLLPLAATTIGFFRKALSLRRDDVDIGDVLTKPLDRLLREYDPASLLGRVARTGPPGMGSATDPYMEAVRRAVADRTAILEAVRRMPKQDRRLLPDVVPTVNALVERIAGLAPTLARLDADLQPNTLTQLDARIADAERSGATGAEQERKVALLKRQRTSLQDLVKRRDVLLAQLESAGLLLQNLKLDLIKVRSTGVGGSVDGVNNATQEARALSREIGYVLGAADEVRDL